VPLRQNQGTIVRGRTNPTISSPLAPGATQSGGISSSQSADYAFAQQVLQTLQPLTTPSLTVNGPALVQGTQEATSFQTYWRTTSVVEEVLTTLPSGSFTVVGFDTAVQDPQGNWDLTNFRVQPTQPGVYLFQGAVCLLTDSATQASTVSIFATPAGSSAAELQRGLQVVTTSAVTITLPFCFAVLLPSNAYGNGAAPATLGSLLDIRVFQNSGATIETVPSSNSNGPCTYLNIIFLGGS
jgi:hypothetical protein